MCVAVALAQLRARGLRIIPYLDDWLVCAPTQERVHNDTSILLDQLSRLGLIFSQEFFDTESTIGLCRHCSRHSSHDCLPIPTEGVDCLVSHVLRCMELWTTTTVDGKTEPFRWWYLWGFCSCASNRYGSTAKASIPSGTSTDLFGPPASAWGTSGPGGTGTADEVQPCSSAGVSL